MEESAMKDILLIIIPLIAAGTTLTFSLKKFGNKCIP